MEAIGFVIAGVLGLAFVFTLLSRNRLAGEIESARAAAERARAEAAAARREAEKRAEDKKGRAEELAATRAKLADAKRRLHESQEAERRARELVGARADELRVIEEQLAHLREENASLAEELRRLREEAERPRSARREPAAPAPAPAVVAAPVPVPVDERLAQMAREVEAYKEQAQEAERRRANAERQANEARKQAAEAREEVKRARGRAEANNRVYLVAKGEAELWKDRYAHLEQKWNELWRELEGIGWSGRTSRDLDAPAAGGEGRRGRGRRRGPRRPDGTGVEATAPGATEAGAGSAAAEVATGIQPVRDGAEAERAHAATEAEAPATAPEAPAEEAEASADERRAAPVATGEADASRVDAAQPRGYHLVPRLERGRRRQRPDAQGTTGPGALDQHQVPGAHHQATGRAAHIRQEGDDGGPGRDALDLTDDAPRGDDRHAAPDAVAAAPVDDDLAVPARGLPLDDVRGQQAVVVELGQPQLPAELPVFSGHTGQHGELEGEALVVREQLLVAATEGGQLPQVVQALLDPPLQVGHQRLAGREEVGEPALRRATLGPGLRAEEGRADQDDGAHDGQSRRQPPGSASLRVGLPLPPGTHRGSVSSRCRPSSGPAGSF